MQVKFLGDGVNRIGAVKSLGAINQVMRVYQGSDERNEK